MYSLYCRFLSLWLVTLGFQPLLFLWDPPGCLLLPAFDKEIIWNGSRQAQVVGPPATISSALLDSIIVLGLNLCILFSFSSFFFFFFLAKVSFQFIYAGVWEGELWWKTLFPWSWKGNLLEYCNQENRLFFCIISTLWQAQQKWNQKVFFFFLRCIPHLSFPSLPNSFMCLITHLLLPAPRFYVAMHSTNRISHSLIWLCYSQAESQPQRASTVVICYGRGFLFSGNLLSIYTWHLVARSQVHCWCKALCLAIVDWSCTHGH